MKESIFEASEAPKQWEGTISKKRRLFHWFSRNSELEATWIILIWWPQKTSKHYVIKGIKMPFWKLPRLLPQFATACFCAKKNYVCICKKTIQPDQNKLQNSKYDETHWICIIVFFYNCFLIFTGSSEEEELNNLVEDETDIFCCQNGRKLPPNQLHPECLPIEIPSNDFFFSRFGQKCMEFVRSMPAERPDCSLGPREQVRKEFTMISKTLLRCVWTFYKMWHW